MLTLTAERIVRGKRVVLTDVDLAFAESGLTVLLGGNGLGKSTVLRALAGLDAGHSVMVDGRSLLTMNGSERAASVSWLAQRSPLESAFLVHEVVAQGRFAQGRDHQKILEAMRITGVTALADRPFDMLSGGERQRVLIARCVAQGARYFLCDEPTVYLDPAGGAQVRGLLGQLSQHQAVIVATHDFSLTRLAQRVLILGRPGGAQHHPEVPARIVADIPGQDFSQQHWQLAYGLTEMTP